MLTEISLENFKPFRSEVRVPLAPLTLIYGPNSGGKSSLIQSILLLKQTVEGHSERFTGLIPQGDYVDLGSFLSLVHGHQRKLPVRLGMSFSGRPRDPEGRRQFSQSVFPREDSREVRLEFRQARSVTNRMDASDLRAVFYGSSGETDLNLLLERDTRISRGATYRDPRVFRWADPDSIRSLSSTSAHLAMALSSLRRQGGIRAPEQVARNVGFELGSVRRSQNIRPSSGDESAFRAELQTALDSGDESESARILADRVELALAGSHVGAVSLLPTRLRESRRPRDQGFFGSIRSLPNRMIDDIASDFYRTLGSVAYLGPLRSAPARHYLISGGRTFDVGIQGEYAPEVLYQTGGGITDATNKWLEQFDIPYSLEVNSVGDQVTGQMIAMSVYDQNRLAVAPSDVGFGIGQLLPILVQAVVANRSRGAITCVEQPEIHLHPKLQAHLADLFIETSGAGNTGMEDESARSEHQWIVETHSEALMLRLQRRIREGKVDPNQVAVLYVERVPDGTSSTVTQLRLDEHGDFIDEWPEGFFEEGFDEIFTGGG